jgi:hypothetical protein
MPYAPWKGFSLWGVFIVADMLTIRSGHLVLIGMILAFVWSQKG